MVANRARSGNSVPVETNGQTAPCLLASAAEARKPRPLTWIVPHLIAEGMVNVIQGKKGSGKSFFTAYAAAVWRGVQKPPGCNGKRRRRGRVFIASEEPYFDMVFPRLKAAGLKDSDILYPQKQGGGATARLRLPDDWEIIEQAVKHQNVGLVLFEPFAHFLAPGKSANDDGCLRDAIDAAVRLGQDHGVTTIAHQHMRKTKADTKLEQGRGGGGLAEVARSVVQLDKPSPKESNGVLECVGTNLGPGGRRWPYEIKSVAKGARFLLGEELDVGPEADLVALEEQSKHTQLARAKQMLQGVLRQGGVDSKLVFSVGERWGLSQTTVWRASEELGCTHERVGNGSDHKSVWHLPAKNGKK